ncbi:hypothetical protein [Streptomyces flaveus]|nr:hypothetical protein [Streptomyces flaveus]
MERPVSRCTTWRRRFRKITSVWADDGYAGRLVNWAKERLHLTLQIVERSDARAPQLRPAR